MIPGPSPRTPRSPRVDRPPTMEDKTLTPDFVADVVRAMQKWDIQKCAVVVVPMEKGMGPPAGRFFGGRDADQVTRRTAFPLASGSKHITALALHLALTRLGLSFKTKVVDILPEFGLQDGKEGKEVTVEDLLCHRTGLPGWDGMYKPGLSEDFLNKIKHLPIPPLPPSGIRPFQYNSLMFDVAARIVQRLTDKRIDEYVQEEFFDPLQLKASYHADQVGEKADGRWSRIGMGKAKPTEFPVDKEVEVSVAVKEDGADIVEKGVEVDYEIEKCGEAWGAGRVWMNSDDLIRWLVCAPKMPGFDNVATPRSTDPDDGLFFPDEAQGYGLGLRVFKHRGVDVLCHNGSIPGYAHQIAWLPKLKVGFAVLSNSDVGGTFLRSLVACRLIEAAADMEKKDWFNIVDVRYTAYTSPKTWMDPTHGSSLSNGNISPIAGKWAHPAYGTWMIWPTDLVSLRPALGTLPYFPELSGPCKRIFTPVATVDGQDGEARYAGCYECKVGGKVYYGMPFEVVIRNEGGLMEVRGLSGAEGEGQDELCPLVFVRE